MPTRTSLPRPVADALARSALAGDVLQCACHGIAAASGWHHDPTTGTAQSPLSNKLLFAVKLALVHSELSEALEGHRRGAMDDHLPERTMAEVELADAVIRIFDLAGQMNYSLGETIREKLRYNINRLDHKPENRAKPGGKLY